MSVGGNLHHYHLCVFRPLYLCLSATLSVSIGHSICVYRPSRPCAKLLLYAQKVEIRYIRLGFLETNVTEVVYLKI